MHRLKKKNTYAHEPSVSTGNLKNASQTVPRLRCGICRNQHLDLWPPRWLWQRVVDAARQPEVKASNPRHVDPHQTASYSADPYPPNFPARERQVFVTQKSTTSGDLIEHHCFLPYSNPEYKRRQNAGLQNIQTKDEKYCLYWSSSRMWKKLTGQWCFYSLFCNLDMCLLTKTHIVWMFNVLWKCLKVSAF